MGENNSLLSHVYCISDSFLEQGRYEIVSLKRNRKRLLISVLLGEGIAVCGVGGRSKGLAESC